MIRIQGLSHYYAGGRRQPPHLAVDNLTLSVDKGEFAILSGPNGSGKSTLFRVLCGLSLPSRGSVAIGGFDLVAQSDRIRAILGVVFQSPAVDKHLTVQENLALHADLYGLRGADLRAAMDHALTWTDLVGRLDQKVDTLSGGLARQVELAKVLMTKPAVLVLDEPTTGLDPAARRTFLAALHRLKAERGMTILMTSHIFSEADGVDRVAIMQDGKLMAYDRPQALTAMIGTEMVVIRPKGDAQALAVRLRDDLGLAVRHHGDELRLEETENGHSLPLLERILEAHRADVASISIKQPDLEDVFVHVTGKAVPDDAATPAATKKETSR